MRSLLKRILPLQWQTRAHSLSRLRWITKYRLLHHFGLRLRHNLRAGLKYVLLDPETESFTYALDNEHDVVDALAGPLRTSRRDLLGFIAETRTDPELNERLAHHLRRRFDVKHRPQLGNRLVWYLIARALKPELIVETGIYQGLGSLGLLRALERNAAEGRPGELLSFDMNPRAGSVVREELHARWRRVVGSTSDLLVPALEGRSVGMLIHDTPHTDENQRLEFGAALAHAAPRLVLVDSSGCMPTLSLLCAERAVPYHRIELRSRAHIYPGAKLAFALFESEGSAKPADRGRIGTDGESKAGLERRDQGRRMEGAIEDAEARIEELRCRVPGGYALWDIHIPHSRRCDPALRGDRDRLRRLAHNGGPDPDGRWHTRVGALALLLAGVELTPWSGGARPGGRARPLRRRSRPSSLTSGRPPFPTRVSASRSRVNAWSGVAQLSAEWRFRWRPS